jgi:hypothetical protein
MSFKYRVRRMENIIICNLDTYMPTFAKIVQLAFICYEDLKKDERYSIELKFEIPFFS